MDGLEKIQSMNGWLSGRTDEWKKRRKDGWMNVVLFDHNAENALLATLKF